MKKFLLTMMIAVATVFFGACGSTESASNIPAVTDNTKSDTLVVYFSCTGNTKALAQNVAEVLKADLFEIQPEQPYTNEDLNYNNKATRSSIEQNDTSARPKIANKVDNIEHYNTVVIAYPIWWNQEPRIIDTFLESYDFSGKTLVPICTSGGSDIAASVNYLKNAVPSAKWLDGKRFNRNASKADIEVWFKKLDIIK